MTTTQILINLGVWLLVVLVLVPFCISLGYSKRIRDESKLDVRLDSEEKNEP